MAYLVLVPLEKIICESALQCIFAALKSGQVYYGDAGSSKLYMFVFEIFYAGHRVQVLANQGSQDAGSRPVQDAYSGYT